MDEDLPEPSARKYPLSPAKMSKTPSWIMLGFVLGALTVIALPPLRKEKPVVDTAPLFREPAKPRAPAEPPRLTTIEAVFAEWGGNAVWSDGVTEVALWNSARESYSDFFEVRRYADTFYFRSIPELTRRVINRGKQLGSSPLQFTETEEQYQEWRQYGRMERPSDQAPGSFKPIFSRPEAPTPKVEAPVLPPPESQRPPAAPNREAGGSGSR